MNKELNVAEELNEVLYKSYNEYVATKGKGVKIKRLYRIKDFEKVCEKKGLTRTKIAIYSSVWGDFSLKDKYFMIFKKGFISSNQVSILLARIEFALSKEK